MKCVELVKGNFSGVKCSLKVEFAERKKLFENLGKLWKDKNTSCVVQSLVDSCHHTLIPIWVFFFNLIHDGFLLLHSYNLITVNLDIIRIYKYEDLSLLQKWESLTRKTLHVSEFQLYYSNLTFLVTGHALHMLSHTLISYIVAKTNHSKQRFWRLNTNADSALFKAKYFS